MGFVKTKQELDRYYGLGVREFIDAKMLGVMFETRMEIIERLSSRFVIIHEGRTRLEGSLAEIRSNLGTLEDVFLSVTNPDDDREASPA